MVRTHDLLHSGIARTGKGAPETPGESLACISSGGNQSGRSAR